MKKTSRQKEWYWGHPEAEPIDSSEYQKEKSEVAKVVTAYHDNPSIQEAVRSVDEWLEEAYQAKYYLYKWLMDRLWEAGIRGSDVLTEASAIMLFRYRNPSRFQNDRHHLHVLGSKIIRLVPYWGRTRGYEHHGIGLNVRRKLAGTDVGVCSAVLKGQKYASMVKQDMSSPLEF